MSESGDDLHAYLWNRETCRKPIRGIWGFSYGGSRLIESEIQGRLETEMIRVLRLEWSYRVGLWWGMSMIGEKGGVKS